MTKNDEDKVNRKKRLSTNIELMYTGVPIDERTYDRTEKPWQRVINEFTRKGKHLYEPVKSVPSSLLVLILGLYCLLAYLTQLVEDDMPRVIQDTQVGRDNAVTFSEEASKRYLLSITGDEPRVAGTLYHYQKTIDLKALVDSIAAQATLPVSTDWQMVSGDYYLSSAAPFVNWYQNASNIVALLEGESGFHANGSIASSILLNCHYDSVPYALGASDNMVFCAVMLETLSRMSRRQTKYKHNVIFLFNGAEENPLQGSHGFLQHPWSRGVTAVVNLDAAGMNGKATIFQVTDTRVLNAYKRTVSRPSGQGIGEFLFTSGIIPSDTDFRIWRDFGHYEGIDIAFSKWGHVYHTRYDHPDLLHAGVLQWAGDMLLGLASALADMEEMGHKEESSRAVYFDFLYVFLVTCPRTLSFLADLAVATLGLASVGLYVGLVGARWSTVRELLVAAAGRLVAMIAGALVVAVLVPIMVATTVQMRYLTQPWIVAPLYWVPYLLGAVLTSQAIDAWRTKKCGLNRSVRTLQAQSATRLLLSLTLVLLSCVPGLASARYLVAAPLCLMSLTALVSLTVVRYFRLQAWQHLLLDLVLSLPATMFMFSLALRMDAMMLPIMGRSGYSSPDYLVAGLNVGLAIIVSTPISGIELLFSRQRLWLAAAPVGLTCLVLMFIPFNPYSDDGPSTQRHYWFHSQITTYNADNVATDQTSGVVVTKWDPYTTSDVIPALLAAGIRLNTRTDFTEDCDKYVYCNLPLFRTGQARLLPQALFLYSGPPAPFSPPHSMTLASRSCVGETCTYNFMMTGGQHNTITIWPRADVRLSGWSLSAAPLPGLTQAGRPVYVIGHSVPTYTPLILPTDFNVTLIVPLSLQSQPAMDLSLHSFKLHHPQDYTQEFQNILNAMPKYFNIANFLSFRNNYVF